MTTSWPARPDSSPATAAVLAAAGVSAVVRGHVSLREGEYAWADAVCQNPFDLEEQKRALKDVAAALRPFRVDRAATEAPGGTIAGFGREKLGGRLEIAWSSSEHVFLGCAMAPDGSARFVALWDSALDPADVPQQKDLLRVAICYEMMLVRRNDAMRSAAADARIATQTLNRLAIPLFVVGRDRELVRMNSAGRTWLRTDGRLRLSNRRLIGASAVLNAQMRSAIDGATDGRSAGPTIVPLADLEAKGAAVTLCCAALSQPQDHVLIAVQERRCDVSLAQQTLTALGLTQAECRLASLLGSGMSLQRAAATSGITFSTARSYLKRIFGKLGIARQSDLVGLVAALTPVVIGGGTLSADQAGPSRQSSDFAEKDAAADALAEDLETEPFRQERQDLEIALSESCARQAEASVVSD